jgi:FMN phosphatase YigB (HAD superfamily)
MENIKNIIFDYGNVIFSLDFLKVQEAWKQLGINNPIEFFGHKQQDKIFDKFDRGEVIG